MSNISRVTLPDGNIYDIRDPNVCGGNLLDNPDFAVDQRNNSGTISTAGYFVDRWKLKSGSVTINSDKSITLNGTIEQILETAVGTDVTASASAGTASWDNAAKTFTLTASGKKITWAKLEKGSVATAFCPPNTAIELARCQRYLQKMSALETLRAVYILPNYIDFSVPTPVTVRPGSITVSGSADVYPFPIATAVSGFTFSVVGYAQNQLRFRATKTAHGLTDAVLSVPSGGSILLSSEL